MLITADAEDNKEPEKTNYSGSTSSSRSIMLFLSQHHDDKYITDLHFNTYFNINNY